jgi:hypothetical protein
MLYLFGSRATEAGVADLKQALPKLKVTDATGKNS